MATAELVRPARQDAFVCGTRTPTTANDTTSYLRTGRCPQSTAVSAELQGGGSSIERGREGFGVASMQTQLPGCALPRPRQPLDERWLRLAPSHAIRDSRSGSPMQSVEPNTLQRVVVSANGRHEQALFWLFTSPTIRAWRRGSQGCASNQ